MGGFDYLSFDELRPAPLAPPFDFEEEILLVDAVPNDELSFLVNPHVGGDRVGSHSILSLSVVWSGNIPYRWISLKSIHMQYRSQFTAT